MNRVIFKSSIALLYIVLWVNNIQGQTTTNISLDAAAQIDFGKVVDLSTLSFIHLQTNSNSLIGSDYKVVHNDSLLVILSNKIIGFNLSGDHLFTIDKKGKGPGEYLTLSDILILDNNNFLVLDRQGKKVLHIDSSGATLKTIPIDLHGLTFDFIDKSTLAVYSGSDWTENSKHRLNYLDLEKQKIIKSFFPISQNEYNWRYFIGIQNFQRGANNLYFYMDCNDTIYSISKNRMDPYIIMDFGKNKMPSEYVNREYGSIVDFLTEVEKKNIIYNILQMNIAHEHYSLGFREKRNYYHFIGKQNNSSGVLINNYDNFLGFRELSMKPNFNNFPKYWNSERSFIIIEPADFINQENHKIQSIVSSELGLTLDDNPVIVTFKFKSDL